MRNCPHCHDTSLSLYKQALRHGLSPFLVYDRLRRPGWDRTRALHTPVREHCKIGSAIERYYQQQRPEAIDHA